MLYSDKIVFNVIDIEYKSRVFLKFLLKDEDNTSNSLDYTMKHSNYKCVL